MNEGDATVRFDEERPRLASIAYRMLGTPDDAEDVVQDTWLRWHVADRGAMENPSAWLTTVVTRLAIDRLRSARHRREVYVGPWLPEPVSSDPDPAELAAHADSLTLGFLTVLERLSPVERAVFLLHDVFGLPFVEVAAVVGRTEVNARQLAARARTHVRDEHRRTAPPSPERSRALADAFIGAVVAGDVVALQSLLTDDVVHLSDGGEHRRAARHPIVGPHRVARFLINLGTRIPAGTEIHEVVVNGEPGWYATLGGDPLMVLVPSFQDGRVRRIFGIQNPDKLGRFHRTWSAG